MKETYSRCTACKGSVFEHDPDTSRCLFVPNSFYTHEYYKLVPPLHGPNWQTGRLRIAFKYHPETWFYAGDRDR